MGRYLDTLSELEVNKVKSVKNNFLESARLNNFGEIYGLTNPQNPQNPGEDDERRELAALVLASLRRPGAGLHYSRGLALAWRRVCDLTGQTLDSPALVTWARETLNQWE